MDKYIFESVVKKMQKARDKEGNSLNMDSIMISQGADVFKHKFKNEEALNDLRSISKPIIGLSLGIAMDEGLTLRGEPLTLNTKILPFFQEKIKFTNESNIAKWQRVTLRHVLTHTIGFAEGLLFSKDIKERDPFTLLDYVFNYDITHEPGECFVYSNVGPYILSALIQEELGLNLSDWVNSKFFEKIGIKKYEWKNYGNYCAGATGLRISHDDLHKVGQILVGGGIFEGKQLVPKYWVEAMTKLQVFTPTMYDEKRVFPKYGYGFYIYICKNGNYYIDGTDGQYLIVLKDKGILITTFGHQPDMKPITECFRELL
ncbi:MAG: serine hydrolase [Saprospiraceae bacterium]|nr:serine hydrolase [Saprospiraceae bacterium]